MQTAENNLFESFHDKMKYKFLFAALWPDRGLSCVECIETKISQMRPRCPHLSVVESPKRCSAEDFQGERLKGEKGKHRRWNQRELQVAC